MTIPASLRFGWRAWLLLFVGLLNVAYGLAGNGDVWILVGMGFLALARWFVAP